MFRRLALSTLAIMFAVTLLAGCASSGEGDAFVRDQADPADALTEAKCSLCHTTERVYSASKTADEWDTTMARMKANGLVITDEEYDQILEYLSR